MVSKVAVVALVAIISVPILLGYGMNLQTVSISEYEEKNDSVNVTSLLQNSTSYHYVSVDPYSLNTSFKTQNAGGSAKYLPYYEEVSTVKSSFSMEGKSEYGRNSGDYPQTRLNLTDFKYLTYVSEYDGTGGSLVMTVYNPGGDIPLLTRDKIHSYYWEKSTSKLYYTYFPNRGDNIYMSTSVTIPGDNFTIQLTLDPVYQPYTAAGYFEFEPVNPGTSRYVNFSKGFEVRGIKESSNNTVLDNNQVVLDVPNYARNVLLTVELSSITKSNYTFKLSIDDTYRWSYLGLVKTTDAEGVHWAAYTSHTIGYDVVFDTKIADLFYDPNRTSNTYQIELNLHGGQVRYVGNWPSLIGAAEPLLTYDFDWPYNTSYEGLGIKNVGISSNSPVMRIDAAEFRTFEYPVIQNVTYNPSQFKTYPSTTITNIDRYGDSLTFGGNTYTVKDGNITIGTHSIPVKDIKLESVPTDDGLTWDNRINGTVISSTAAPSSIVFNGQWAVNVSTSSMELTSYNKTEWTPGQFGWDGVDQNFLMVGLLTCLGAFIGLGVYLRRSKGSLWPLLIVCGGAVVLIICML